MKRLIFTVTNDLSYDQRMIRICSTLSKNGYEVLLVGRKFNDSIPLLSMPFKQRRIRCIFNKGFAGYAEYNIRLLCFLLLKKQDLVCAIDLDTIIPCYLISKIKGTIRVYDAHELFCEMKEIATRRRIYKFWKKVEKAFVPSFKNGYTVNAPIADEFFRMYGVKYIVIRNVPVLQELSTAHKKEQYILYQGAVNEGRSFETLIPAMKSIPVPLIICGDGNFMAKAKQLVCEHGLDQKVIFKGKLTPDALKEYTANAWIGITIFDKQGLSNYFSLANRFFDYMHAAIPQICVNYPVYKHINNEFGFALLVNDTEEKTLIDAITNLNHSPELYNRLHENCVKARNVLNWQQEEKYLLAFYNKLFS